MDLLLQGKAQLRASSPDGLAFSYVNSGALYRGIAWLAKEHNIRPDDAVAVCAQVRKVGLQL